MRNSLLKNSGKPLEDSGKPLEDSGKPLENQEGSTTKQAKAQSHETNFGKKRRRPACDGSSPY